MTGAYSRGVQGDIADRDVGVRRSGRREEKRNERRDILISVKAAWCILGGQKAHRKTTP